MGPLPAGACLLALATGRVVEVLDPLAGEPGHRVARRDAALAAKAHGRPSRPDGLWHWRAALPAAAHRVHGACSRVLGVGAGPRRAPRSSASLRPHLACTGPERVWSPAGQSRRATAHASVPTPSPKPEPTPGDRWHFCMSTPGEPRKEFNAAPPRGLAAPSAPQSLCWTPARGRWSRWRPCAGRLRPPAPRAPPP